MKRRIALFLAIILMFTVACSNDQSPSDSSNSNNSNDSSNAEVKDTMVVAIGADPGSINPYDRLENAGRQLWAPVYESLFEYGRDGLKPEPVLVDTYEFSEDEKTLTLKLKEGVKFHNGEEMTADDVLFTFDVLRNSSRASHMGDVDWDNINALDDYTVEVNFNSVQGLATYYLCNLYVLSESYMSSIPQEQWATDCIGTGPYMWEDFIEGAEYNLSRFEEYREPKKLKKIKVRIIPDASVQKIELETGGIDMATQLQHGDVARLAEDTEDGIDIMASDQIAMIQLVHATPDNDGPLADVRVRRAINYALDLEAINKIVFSGLGEPATAIYPTGVTAYAEASGLQEYDRDKAKELLDEAGYSDGLEIDFYTQNATMYQLLTDTVLGMLDQVGIKLNVIASDFGTQDGYLQSGQNPGIYALRQYVNGDPYILAGMWFKADGSYAIATGHPQNEEFSVVADYRDEALAIIDQEERNKVWNQLMDEAYDKQYFTPLIGYADQIAYNEDLKGFWMAGPLYHYEDAYFE